MQHRYIALSLCTVSVLLILTGYLLYHHPGLLGLCSPGRQCLSDAVFYGIAHPLYLHLYPLPFLFAAVAFLPPDLFHSWLRFFFVISVIPVMLIAGAEPVSHSFFPGLPDRAQVTDIAVKFVTLLSVVFIAGAYALRYWKKRKEE